MSATAMIRGEIAKAGWTWTKNNKHDFDQVTEDNALGEPFWLPRRGIQSTE
jgi:hypothetical protein